MEVRSTNQSCPCQTFSQNLNSNKEKAKIFSQKVTHWLCPLTVQPALQSETLPLEVQKECSVLKCGRIHVTGKGILNKILVCKSIRLVLLNIRTDHLQFLHLHFFIWFSSLTSSWQPLQKNQALQVFYVLSISFLINLPFNFFCRLGNEKSHSVSRHLRTLRVY